MRGAVVSSHTLAQENSSQTLQSGGSALKSCLAGFFAAAGAQPGILFSPLTILVGGIGAGVRVFDGRARQPGIQGKRPRGFLDSDDVPTAATAAVPGSINAASLACAYHSGTSLLSCIRVGETEAKRAGAAGRQSLLEQLAGRGTQALGEGALRRAFLAEFGAAAQGNMALADLTTSPEVDHQALEAKDEFRVPWAEEGQSTASNLGEQHISIAADGSGLFVALSFWNLPEHCALQDYQVHLPASAVPVLRGVTRPIPGLPIASPCDLRLLRGTEGQLIGVEASRNLSINSQAMPEFGVYRDPQTKVASIRRSEA